MEVIRAFTAERVRALTGLSKRRIQYWDEQGFIRPSLSARQGRGRRRLYSFPDLVALRTAVQLRDDGISLQLIRKVDQHLRRLDYENPMAQIRFRVIDGRLFFAESGTVRAGRRPEQTLVEVTVPFGRIISDLRRRIEELDARPAGQVERRPRTLGGKLLIAGTRIPVASVQRLHAAGASDSAILELYPDLTTDDIRAALGAPAEGGRRRGRAAN